MHFKLISIITSIILIIIIIVPTFIYYQHFKDFTISDQPEDWGTFGDYIGGVVGTCFSLLAMILALISIYISLKISETVQENEIKFNTENSKREIEKFEKEIELLHKQNKPFPYPNFLKYKELTLIALENHGAGPMVVNNINIHCNSDNYSNFHGFFKAKISRISPDLIIYYNSAPSHILIPGSSKTLLEIKPKAELTDDYTNDQQKIRDLVKDCELSFTYEDIFDTKKDFKVRLDFFKL